MDSRFLSRGKRLDNREWVQGYYRETQGYDCESLHLIHSIEGGVCEDFIVDPATVGQCTELRDKNGTLIFEGDVTRKYIRKDVPYDTTINWFEGGFMRRGVHGMNLIHGYELEVIGNIHDNPELLKGGLHQ